MTFVVYNCTASYILNVIYLCNTPRDTFLLLHLSSLNDITVWMIQHPDLIIESITFKNLGWMFVS